MKIGESLYKPPQPKILSYQVGESKRIADQQQFYDVTEYKAVAKVGEQNFEIKGIGSEKGVLIQGDKGAYVLRGKQVYLISSDQAKSLTLGDVTSRGIGGQKGAFRVEKLEIFSSKGELKSYQLVDISQVRPALEVGGLKSQFVYGEKYAVQKGSFLDISDVYSGMTTERFQYQVNGVTYTEFQQAYGGVSGKKGISELFKDFTVNFHKRGSFESISDLTPKKIENFGWLGKTPKSTGGIGVSKTDLGGVSVSGVKSTGALQRSMSTGKFIVSTIAEARSKGMIPSFELSALGAKQVLSTDFGIKPKQISPIEVSFMLKEKPKIDFGIFDIQKPNNVYQTQLSSHIHFHSFNLL